jgi:hypothetical protein
MKKSNNPILPNLFDKETLNNLKVIINIHQYPYFMVIFDLL